MYNWPYLFANKEMDRTKLKAIVDDYLKVGKIISIGSDRVENIVGKEKNAGYKHFFLFPQSFQRVTASASLNIGIVK